MLIRILKARQEQIILLFILEALHFATWYDLGSHLSKSLLLVHFGMFLIWQPLLESNKQINTLNSLLFIAFTLIFIYLINWPLITIWLTLLIGFIGGRVTTRHYERNMYMLVMVYLLCELFVSFIPQMLDLQLNKVVYYIFQITLPVLPLVLLITSQTLAKKDIESVDILIATSISFMVIILSFGSLVLMYHHKSDYLIALVETLIAVGFILIGISWLSSPNSLFSGFSQLWTKSLLNIGTPFELWLTKLSGQKRSQQSPQDFLDITMNELISLPWIAGVRIPADIELNAGSEYIIYGEPTRHASDLKINEHEITLFTHIKPGNTIYLHCKLLVQLIYIFYHAKQHEQELQQKTHLHAIYEIGSRVTHDIKNILQSLQTITTLLETNSDDTKEKYLALLKKQLPLINQNLQLALDKLQQPEKETVSFCTAEDWWQDLLIRHQNNDIEFYNEIKYNLPVPEELFNSVIDNLLKNALQKKQSGPDIIITVRFTTADQSCVLSVTDSGHAINDDIAKSILTAHIPSDNGYGIGLYQAARYAEQLNYVLQLKQNRHGNVCFELCKKN